MAPLLILYGPLAIHAWGLCFGLGVVCMIWFIARHPLGGPDLHIEKLVDLASVVVPVGIIGARIITILLAPHEYASWYDYCSVWDGGLSALGAVGILVLALPLILSRYRLPVFPLFDLIALHAPLLHICMRTGCWFAGCCSGRPTTAWWGIYDATLGTFVHPAPFISAALYVVLFGILSWRARKPAPPGTFLGWYLLLSGLERLLLDGIRQDALEYVCYGPCTAYQWTALGISGIGLVLLLSTNAMARRVHEPFYRN